MLLQASHGSLLGKRKAAEEPAETTSPFNSPPHMPIVPNGVSRSQVWQHSPVSNTPLCSAPHTLTLQSRVSRCWVTQHGFARDCCNGPLSW